MSLNQARKLIGVHLNRNQRTKVRQKLVNVYGDTCCWCGGPMEIPHKHKSIKDYTNMATIEHYFAKKMKDPDNTMLFRLAHQKCNK